MRVRVLPLLLLCAVLPARAEDDAPQADSRAFGSIVDPRPAPEPRSLLNAEAYPGTELGKLLGKGMAAWYQHPGKTASGAIFDPEKLTAASPDLPLGAQVRVVNRRNDKSVVVEVNDRMTTRRSIRRKFTIELSRAGARAIEMDGIAPVAIYAENEPR